MNEKSEVEQFYAAICSKMGITRQCKTAPTVLSPRNELHPMGQMQFVNHLNGILQIVHNEQRF